MDKMEMVEKLREKADLTIEEAKEILEKNHWDLLDSCVELEKAGKIGGGARSSTEKKADTGYEEVNPTVTGSAYKDGKVAKEERPMHQIRDAIRRLIRMSIDNKFVVRRHGDVLIKVPVLVPIVGLVAAFWITVAVLFLGLVCGLKYSFEGDELGTESINETVEKATEAANDFVKNLKNSSKEE